MVMNPDRPLTELEQQQQVLTVKVRDKTYRVAGGNVPMIVKDYFERETGRSVEYALSTESTVGEVQVALVCYLARLLRGETTLRWRAHLEQWPEGLTADDITVEAAEPEGADPEV